MAEWGFGKRNKLTDNWPKDENGEPVAPVFLNHLPETQLEADIEVNLLESCGIPVLRRYPNDGEFGKLIIGVAGSGVDLFVPETMLEDAQNVISAEIEEEYEAEQDR